MAEINNTQGLKRTVQLNDNVHTILIPYENRKGEWMNYALTELILRDEFTRWK